ncbi:DUF2158 domain-containing protein [Candidatus Latescibacterota bacterium]
MSKFKKGNKVQLKTGSPEMVISDIVPDSYDGHDVYICDWFSMKTDTFEQIGHPAEVLKLSDMAKTNEDEKN